MASGRIRRSARRGIAALVVGWLGVLVASVLLAPSASAAPTATVNIRDLTPPVVSVDAGGSVTFVDQVQDKTLSVGVGPLAVTATVHTDVTLEVPSGSHPLQPGQSLTEKFAQTRATCTISYSYRVEGADLTAVPNLLPALPVPTPFVQLPCTSAGTPQADVVVPGTAPRPPGRRPPPRGRRRRASRRRSTPTTSPQAPRR